MRLGVDPRHADQMVRSSVILPHGTGKSARVLVFAKGEKEREALDAGADFAGSDELIARIKEGWLDFDKTIATPDMMGEVGKIGRILGPRNLMPNAKLGTVTFDIARVVAEIKKGKMDFRVDKAGIVLAQGRRQTGAQRRPHEAARRGAAGQRSALRVGARPRRPPPQRGRGRARPRGGRRPPAGDGGAGGPGLDPRGPGLGAVGFGGGGGGLGPERRARPAGPLLKTPVR